MYSLQGQTNFDLFQFHLISWLFGIVKLKILDKDSFNKADTSCSNQIKEDLSFAYLIVVNFFPSLNKIDFFYWKLKKMEQHRCKYLVTHLLETFLTLIFSFFLFSSEKQRKFCTKWIGKYIIFGPFSVEMLWYWNEIQVQWND